MAVDSFVAKNAPNFLGGGAPDLAVDSNAIATYAAKVGNRRAGTTAERIAATGLDVWEGLEWFDTTLRYSFLYLSGGWVSVGPSGVVTALAGFVVASDTSLTIMGGMVRLYLRITGTFVSSTNYSVATLPAGFRPGSIKYGALVFVGSSFPAAGGIEISVDGTVILYNGPGAHTNAGGYIQFPVGG